MQYGYIKKISSTFRKNHLDAYQFDTLEQLRILFTEWHYYYNYLHSHKLLNRKIQATAAKIYWWV